MQSLEKEINIRGAKENPGVVYMQIPSNTADPEDELICKEQMEYTAKIVKNLSDYGKTVFNERVFEKTPYKKLGKIVRESDGKVWKKCKQIALKLKDEFYKIDRESKGDRLVEVM